MAKLALGTWAWGSGAFGGDTEFGSKTDVAYTAFKHACGKHTGPGMKSLAPYREMILYRNAEQLFGSEK